jgi:glutamate dehydrogenase
MSLDTKHALDDLVEEALPPGGEDPLLRSLLHHYYAHVRFEDLTGRQPADIVAAAVSHRDLAQNRPQGRASLRVFTPTRERDGWSAAGRTVVQIVNDDMPFLVDTVTAYLTEAGFDWELVIHPQIVLERDVAGQLREIQGLIGAEDQPLQPMQIRESWMHVELAPTGAGIDEEQQRRIGAGLADRLRGVREVVEDWQKMNERAQAVIDDLRRTPPPVPSEDVAEAEALLTWLRRDNFVFLGYREYVLRVDEDGGDLLHTEPGTGLGLLRSDTEQSRGIGRRLPPPVQAKAREKKLLIVTKTNARSTVHRPVHLDYLGIKTFGADGEVVGERRFIGLFTSTAYTDSVTRIPVLRRKAARVLAKLEYAPGSHSGKALMDFLETYPRDELFQTSVEQLAATAETVLHMQGRRQVKLFVRRDDYGRFLSCVVYLPRDRYTTSVRRRMERILASAIGGEPTVDYTAWVTESVLARLHYVLRAPLSSSVPEVDVASLEVRLADATRSWADDFERALLERRAAGEATPSGLSPDGFPEAYKEDFSARTGVADLALLASLDHGDGDGDGAIAIHLRRPAASRGGDGRCTIYRTGEPLSLSELLPIFTALGVEVVDERPYGITRPHGTAWVYDFGLRDLGEVEGPGADRFVDAFLACWHGRTEVDGFNRLVVAAGLTWRQVSIVRAYAKYLRQAGIPFSQRYIEASLLSNIDLTRLVVGLFEARFDPAGRHLGADAESRVAKIEDVEANIARALDEVASLDQDRILRSYRSLICATVRTSFYQTDDDGRPRSYTAFKLEPGRVEELPQPRPRFEIFVHSPRVEGVHLRFGPVARGGLRWSDRAEDFRTEVLGLVKAQMVKNAVIVPVGAKGGFYCKQLPDPTVDREAWMAEGVACYTTFITALLDVTDNLVEGKVVPPEDVVRHDGDDSYLVVAADKGTATFSDIANKIALDRGFWLGDAFASGGSVGYDHKAMGITARGAWVSVQRHFREMGVDCQSEDFTCVGVGDMSGDVFGNGMLLSEHTRLVAAFDHRHIFIDPDPDAATSFEERRRLFDLPRSSWADYDLSLISDGGGVFARTAKSIKVNEQMRTALGLESETTSMTPPQLLNAILKAPVDLLWNGGIGTYVKAGSEPHSAAGDKANDAIRVDGAELRCRCVGEGGNLGLTQLGRIEYARNGGRINTDFIDNSAGVDTSDHEVNIKILLDAVVANGELEPDARNELLASMTDEVGALVLADNYEQNVAMANAMDHAPSMLHVHGDWIRRLERRGLINRQLEFLPSTKEISNRVSVGAGLTAPEAAVLLAYTKIVLADELMESGSADEDFLRGLLFKYFPSQMRQHLRQYMQDHPLRRSIVVTQIVNDLVNGAGITFFHRLSGETGADAAELAIAHAVALELIGGVSLTDAINELDNQIDAGVQTRMRLAVRQLAERVTRWLVTNRRHGDAEACVDFFDPGVQRVIRALPQLLCGRERDALERRAAELREYGVPDELAVRVASTPPAYTALSIVDIAKAASLDVLEVARVHFVLGEQLGLDRVTERILALPRDDRWRTMARAAMRDDLHAVHAKLTARVLSTTDADAPAEKRIEQWAADEGATLERTMATLEEIWAEEASDLARLSVGLRVVRSLVSD